jgi:hypothetical protein
MKKGVFTPAVLVCCFMACFAIIVDLSGKWMGNVKGPDGSDIVLIYVFKVEGDKLTGTVQQQNEADATQIDSGKINGNNITFSVTTSDGTVIPHTGIFYGDSVGMNFNYQGMKFHTILKRADK